MFVFALCDPINLLLDQVLQKQLLWECQLVQRRLQSKHVYFHHFSHLNREGNNFTLPAPFHSVHLPLSLSETSPDPWLQGQLSLAQRKALTRAQSYETLSQVFPFEAFCFMFSYEVCSDATDLFYEQHREHLMPDFLLWILQQGEGLV